ncbi:MAG: glycerol-3-phosphate ABC transporter permease [Acidimicrobiaceae bacterium]|nr:glycerol-3-phosphate ABC transporter permease [Acidimicrobiaceae bacterium]
MVDRTTGPLWRLSNLRTVMAAERRPTGIRLLGRYGLLLFVAFATLFPIYTTLVAAFKPGDQVLVNPLLPDSFTLEPIMTAWSDGNLGRYLFNSLVVAVVVTVAQVVTSLLSGYAFAMLDFPGRNLAFALFLATLLVPIEATLVVNRRTVDSLDWLNTYQGLAVPFLATAFGTFLIRQALLAVPGELRDAARIDGAGHLAFLRYVALPIIVPTVGALALFSFLSSWNQYLWPNLITTEESMNTVQSGLTLLRRSSIDEPNALMAGTVIAAVPIFVALLLFQRSLVRGLTSGAVKG